MTGGFAKKLPVTDDIYQVLVSSDDEDFSEPDDGSVGDLGRIGVVLPLRWHLAHFRQKRTVLSWWLGSVSTGIQMRS